MPTGPSPHKPVPQLGGTRVPNSSVFLPTHAVPGTAVQGRAPIGSQVSFQGRSAEVSADGAFSLFIPGDARGKLPVRIVRPQGQTPVTLQIEARKP